MLPASMKAPEGVGDGRSLLVGGNLNWMAEIVGMLRATSKHDFSMYRKETLERRIKRRINVLSKGKSIDYLGVLRNNIQERRLLCEVMSRGNSRFFRSLRNMEYISDNIIPEIFQNRDHEQAIRIWVPGCGTGEEALSLAMLILEQVPSDHSDVRLQVFGTDTSPDAIKQARTGWYPATIEADVTPARLARFFLPENGGYKVVRELRRSLIFAEHDVMIDPPFVKLDLLVCRNLIRHLRPEAQQKVASQFHRTLRTGGTLVLGGADPIDAFRDGFEAVSNAARVYRAIDGTSSRTMAGSEKDADVRLSAPRPVASRPVVRQTSRQEVLAEMSRHLVIDQYAPATALINANYECLYLLGPIDRYLQPAPRQATNDFLGMVQPALRAKVRSAIKQAFQANTRIVVAASTRDQAGATMWFSLNAQPVQSDGEGLLLISFVDIPQPNGVKDEVPSDDNYSQIAVLEKELRETRAELEASLQLIDQMGESHAETLAGWDSLFRDQVLINENFLVANSELNFSNNELAAANKVISGEIEKLKNEFVLFQKIIHEAEIAAIILDPDLKIRYFTPAMRSLFNVIAKDLGRPLADIQPQVSDPTLLDDSRLVIETALPIEKEIEARPGVWLARRILPYCAPDNGAGGVLITFADITERKQAIRELEVARQQIKIADITKSRFIAVASHDLRQPLQTLILLLGVLGKGVRSEAEQKLLTLLDQTCSAMSGMMDALLEVDQIASGNVQPNVIDVPVDELFSRLQDEFAYHALARGLTLRVVPTKLAISTDPRLFEQMLRNLLSNALKYTKSGKVLLGCRRRGNNLSIEVWDTGIGIPDVELLAIFNEYNQLDNPTHERSRGFGLGLSIVKRLADILGHEVSVRSLPGKGTVFSTTVKQSSQPWPLPAVSEADHVDFTRRTASILVVEDDPDIRHGLELFLTGEGHFVSAAPDGATALESAAWSVIRPDLIVAAHHLPRGIDGFGVAQRLRDHFHHRIPAVILGGETAADHAETDNQEDMLQAGKPVKSQELREMIQNLLPPASDHHGQADTVASRKRSIVFIVDDDRLVRDAVRRVLEEDGWTVQDYASAEDFLGSVPSGLGGCLLVDESLPGGMSGLDLLRLLDAEGRRLPAIMITGRGDMTIGVQAMKAGAFDAIEKPLSRENLLASVVQALDSVDAVQGDEPALVDPVDHTAPNLVAMLTARELQILKLVLAGNPSKIIARDLGISQRTVENHRASIMRKTGAKSLPTLARLAMGSL